jgi:hypothetical protein
MPPRLRLELLLPKPRRLELASGGFALRGPLALRPPPGFASPALEALRGELARRGASLEPGARAIELELDGRSGHPHEGYALAIGPERARLVAARGVGLNHGLRTLAQLVRLAEEQDGTAWLPALALEDFPAFERRGVMLDVSRDRVPRMDCLFQLVDRLAEWKLNELQLYCEHAFAYRGHERVWSGVDPLTPDELRALDRHCRLHGIELVANQQSFAHLHHWLKHAEYRHLAEVPEGIVHPFLGAGETHPEPFSLCPTDPRSLAFLAGLYDELLPCGSSAELNVGLDETIDLGPGRSAAVIRESGVGRVYLDFLRSVHELVSARGKRMQFWADILLHHPALVPEVPKDAVALAWGYEHDHPFEEETRVLAEAGLAFYVCPGTSSWQSLGGRLENMLANIRSAATWGAARGARGLLVTDWGDRGHLQPPSASWAGYLTAAERAWNPDGAAHEDGGESERLACLMDQHVFGSAIGGLGASALALARAAHACGTRTRNASPLSLLLTKFDQPFPPPELSGLEIGGLRRARALCAEPGHLPAGPTADEASLAAHELTWVARILAFACALGETRLQAGPTVPLAALPARRRAALADDLAALITGHRALWLERSRPGGLARSARWLERVLAELREG